MDNSGNPWDLAAVASPSARQVAAFAVLVWRHAGGDGVEIGISRSGATGAAALTTVTIVLGDDPVVGEVLGRVARAAPGLRDLAALHWRSRWFAPAEGVSLRFPVSGNADGGAVVSESGHPGRDARLAMQFAALVAQFAGDATRRVSDLPLMGASGRTGMISAWSGGPPCDLAGNDGLYDLFAATVAARPQAPAVIGAVGVLTYAGLAERVRLLAGRIRAGCLRDGADPASTPLIAILLPRGPDLYAAMLAVLRLGAVYVPLDPGHPAERLRAILADAGVAWTITDRDHAGLVGGAPLLLVDAAADGDAPEVPPPVHRHGDDPCYVIFTSGSTGRPKGVAVPHRAVVHLVRAEAALFHVAPEDRVLQGFSPAFDASVEEIWLAFAAGATLVPAPASIVRDGQALPRFIAEHAVTVYSCVPTALAMMDGDLASVRLLILGGETCPPALVERWARPGRRLVNTYGPTEATVVATAAELHPGRPVTIGRPLPGYQVFVLDRQGVPQPPGAAGELHLAGTALALGYLGRPDLTRERFIAAPWPGGPRLYRTGDLVRFEEDGDLAFLGRVDAQVKIRGFRVEPGEIEAALLAQPGVRQAAVAVVAETGVQRIVAFVAGAVDAAALHDALRRRLPVYMVPAQIEVLGALPLLASGKVDRSRLAIPRPRGATHGGESGTILELRLAKAWGESLGLPGPVGLDLDFFRDLGGHSLLAAQVASRLRRDTGLTGVSVADLYAFPSVRVLAAELEARRVRSGVVQRPVAAVAGSVARRHRWSSYGQAAGVYVLAGIHGLTWLAPYIAYVLLLAYGTPALDAALIALATLAVLPVFFLALALAAKWLLLGRVRPGRHPLWGWFHLRWWFVGRVIEAAPVANLIGSPLLNAYARLMGARIGRGVHLGSADIPVFDLVDLGDGAVVGTETKLLTATVEDGQLVLDRVRVGTGASIGARCILAPGSVVEDQARLDDLSLLPAGSRIGAGTTWAGSPARPVGSGGVPSGGIVSAGAWAIAFYLSAVLAIPLVSIAALLPGVALLFTLGQSGHAWWWPFALAPVAACSFVWLIGVLILAAKWTLLGRVRAGSHPLHGWFYLRHWFVDRLLHLSLDLLGPLYATLWFNPWYRMLGAKVGPLAEVSTASDTSPDQVRIGAGAFIADAVCLGPARIVAGRIVIEPVAVGERAFIGNSAVLPSGSMVGARALVGVLSRPPADGRMPPDSSWLGSPAIHLPQRQGDVQPADPGRTYAPPWWRIGQRLAFELIRVVGPATGTCTATCLLLGAIAVLAGALPWWVLLGIFPAIYLGTGILVAIGVVAAKWLLMGRYHPGTRPLWCGFVWRTELLTALHEHLADPWLIDLVSGTRFAPWFFRLLGVRIGRRVWLHTTAITEFDLITIGDDAAINADATLQGHLFEDRVMKMSTITIGTGCSIGAGAVVLYDTVMENGSRLGALSLLMKGETLPGGTAWEGTPARRMA